jgi:hypothetical protein
LPRRGDVEEPLLRGDRGRGRSWAPQEQGTRRHGRLREVRGHGGAEDVEAEEQVHGRADPELHQVEDEPRHLTQPEQRRPLITVFVRPPFAIPLLAAPREEE